MLDKMRQDKTRLKQNSGKLLKQNERQSPVPEIELLGIGSSRHKKLRANLLAAMEILQLQVPIKEVSDIDELMEYDISAIPALIVDGKAIFQQVVPTVDDIVIVLKVLLGSEPNREKENHHQAVQTELNEKKHLMKKILVPTDFSENAENALTYAVAIANHFGGTITLLHTYKVYSSAGMFLSVESYMEKEAAKNMLQIVNRIEPRLERGAAIESRIIRGDAVPVISDMADKSGYGLIIMGTQGSSALKEIFTGSTTNGVMRSTDTAVLAIPNGYDFKPIKNIVFAVDEEGISHAGITVPLAKIAKSFGAMVHVFHQDVGTEDDGIDPSIDIFLNGVEHSFHYELDEQAVNESINNFVAEYDAGLLCMVRRKRGFLEEAFHVSNTTKEVFNSPVPLLILHDEGV